MRLGTSTVSKFDRDSGSSFSSQESSIWRKKTHVTTRTNLAQHNAQTYIAESDKEQEKQNMKHKQYYRVGEYGNRSKREAF